MRSVISKKKNTAQNFKLRDCAIIIGGGGGLESEPHIEKYYVVPPTANQGKLNSLIALYCNAFDVSVCDKQYLILNDVRQIRPFPSSLIAHRLLSHLVCLLNHH